MDGDPITPRINAAFKSVPRPAPESITDCTCEECMEIRTDFAERDPDDLEAGRMRYHAWDMTFLTPEARHYFLPGWMRLGIRHPDLAYSDAVIELLLRGEGWESGEGWEKPGRYSIDQRQAILAFLELIRRRNGESYNEDLEAVWECWREPEPGHHEYTIRRLNPGEADLYRRVRLESLRESPEAFASTYEAALGRTDESWSAQADASASGGDRATFVVLADQPVGLAALYRDEEQPGEGELIQVWVSPGHRGGKIANGLMDAVFGWAGSHGFETIRAEVTPNNSRALRFYENYGFSLADADGHPDDSSRVLRMKVGQGDRGDSAALHASS